MTLDSWIAAALPQGCTDDLVPQMDIEGAEYESIISITNGHLRRFRLIVVEFHFLDQLWSRPFFDVASRALRSCFNSIRAYTSIQITAVDPWILMASIFRGSPSLLFCETIAEFCLATLKACLIRSMWIVLQSQH